MTITIINQEDIWQLSEVVPEDLLRSCDLCICALEGEDLKGVLLAQAVLKETWDITYAYVEDTARRSGVAKAMLDLLALTLSTAGAGALTMTYVGGDKEDLLSYFAQSAGFRVVRENRVLETTLSAASIALESKRKKGTFNGKLIPLRDVTNNTWSRFCNLLSERRAHAKNTIDNQVYLNPGMTESYQKDLSILAVKESGEPCGCILVRHVDDYVSVEYLCNLDENNPFVLLSMLLASCDSAEQRYGEIKICFHTYNPKAEKLAKTLLGKYAKELGTVCYAIKYI